MNTTNNTNMIAICQMFAQKQGGQITPLNRKTDARPVREDVNPGDTTDKSRNTDAHTAEKRDNARFDDALRKKIEDEVARRPKDSKPSPKKELEEKEVTEGTTDASNGPDQTQSNTQPLENAVQSKINGSIPPATNPSAAKQTADPSAAVENMATGDTPGENTTQPGQAMTDKPAPSVPAARPVATNVDQSAEQPSDMPAAIKSQSPQTTAEGDTAINHQAMPERTQRPAPNQHYIPTEAARTQVDKTPRENAQTIAAARQDAAAVKQEPQAAMPTTQVPQNTEKHENLSKEQASIHRMNVSIEQIESIKAEKQQIISEKSDFKSELGIDRQFQDEISMSQVVNDKAPSITRQAEIIVNEGSKLNVAQQVQESVRTSYNSGNQQIVIRLDPPDLGRVTIKFTEHRDGITGTLYVDKGQTLHEIQQALPAMLQNLQNADIQIRKMEVVLNNPQQENTAGEFNGDNDGFRQQHSSGEQADTPAVGYPQDAPHVKGYTHANPAMELSDKSINMLI